MLALSREAVGDVAEFVFCEHIQQSQWFFAHVVRDMFGIGRNPHGITRREWVGRTVNHDLSTTSDDVVHLGGFMGVPPRWSTRTHRHLCDADDHLPRRHRVTTDEFPPSHAAALGAHPLVLRYVTHPRDDGHVALLIAHVRHARRHYSLVVDLNGAHVLVTGASRGIGEAIAREAARRGAKVIGVARSAGALNTVMQSIGGIAYACDLSIEAERTSLVARLEAIHGPIDVLINNAGVDDTRMFANATDIDINKVITLNQIVPIELMRQALPLMQSRGRGHVVNISSLAAAGGFAGMTLYCSSKAGLSGFHRVLRHEMRGSPVGLTIVEIGPIPTDMLASVKGLNAPERMFTRFRRMQLLPEVPRERVATAVCNAVQRNTASVCLPKRAKIYPVLVGLPQRIVNALTFDIKR